MSDKFKPQKEDLSPVTDLLDLSVVTEDDLKQAIAKWEKEVKSEFKNLLQAEIRNGD